MLFVLSAWRSAMVVVHASAGRGWLAVVEASDGRSRSWVGLAELERTTPTLHPLTSVEGVGPFLLRGGMIVVDPFPAAGRSTVGRDAVDREGKPVR